MPRKKRETSNVDMQALADLAGVSRSTVSRALNDSPLVSDRTKEKIRELALKHNFVVNETARSLRLKRSNIVCLVLMHDVEVGHHLSDPFFLRMVGCVVDALAEAGHDLMLYHKPVETAAEFLSTRVYSQCDGAIFIGQGTIHDELNKLAEYPKPIVVWGANMPGRNYRIVGTDNVKGGEQATRHLLEQGCRKIAFFGDTRKPELALRHNGFTAALRSAGLAPTASLELKPPAASAISSLKRHGISVPDDVAVTGYDDLEVGARMSPALTTVSQDIRTGGAQLVKKMMGLLSGKQVRDSICDSSLVVRESSLRSGQ